MINSKKNNSHHNRTIRKAIERFCKEHHLNVPMRTGPYGYYPLKTNTLVFSSPQAARAFAQNDEWGEAMAVVDNTVCLDKRYACMAFEDTLLYLFSVSVKALSKLRLAKKHGIDAIIDINGKRIDIPLFEPTVKRVRKVSPDYA